MVTGRRVDAGERLVAELEALGGDVRFVQTDMAEPEQRRLPAEHHRMTELRIAVLGASRMRAGDPLRPDTRAPPRRRAGSGPWPCSDLRPDLRGRASGWFLCRLGRRRRPPAIGDRQRIAGVVVRVGKMLDVHSRAGRSASRSACCPKLVPRSTQGGITAARCDLGCLFGVDAALCLRHKIFQPDRLA